MKNYMDDEDRDEDLDRCEAFMRCRGTQAANILTQLVEATEEVSEYQAGYFRGKLACIEVWMNPADALALEEAKSAVEAYCKQLDEVKK